jgi:hypothetical protein
MDAAEFGGNESQVADDGEAGEPGLQVLAKERRQPAVSTAEEHLAGPGDPAVTVQGDGDVNVRQPLSQGGGVGWIDGVGGHVPPERGGLVDGVERGPARVSGGRGDFEGATLEAAMEGHEPYPSAAHGALNDVRVGQQLAPRGRAGGLRDHPGSQ